MSLQVKIPPMGESIASGILAKWHVANGATVKKNQVIFELETDKITSEGTAETDGVITFAVEAGTEVKIGQVVATIAPGAAGSSAPAAAPAAAAPAKTEATPVSPAVRRLAEETGVNPADVAGSGKGGRVTKGDMLAATEAKPAAPAAPAVTPAPAPVAAPVSSAAPAAPTAGRKSRKKMTPLRAKIAQRLVAVKNETAMLTTFNEVDMTAVRELRAKYQDDFTKKHGVKLGFMSFFVKAVVQALREVPGLNATIEGDEIVTNHFYDVGVAVSTEKGLMVPVLRDCESKGMADLEKDLGNYAKKARDGKITMADLEGGVFTITNGGIFGSLLSTPILNAPQCGILGMHTIQDRPVALNGQVVIRPMMYLALSYDHRIVDGKEAVTFLVKVKQAIEDPSRLLLSV